MPCRVLSPQVLGRGVPPLRSENEINQKERRAPFLKDGNKILPDDCGDFAPEAKYIPVCSRTDSQYAPLAKILLQSVT